MTETFYSAAQSQRIERWSRWFVGAILVCFVAAVARVVQLKVAPDPKLATALRPPMSTHIEMGWRGTVQDRKGRNIAVNEIGHRLFVDPVSLKDLGETAERVGAALRRDPEEIERQILSKPGSRYIVLEQRLQDWQVEAVRELNIHGVAIEPRLLRDHPQGLIAAPIIGLVGFDGKGLAGIERRFDSVLAPDNGRMTYLRDAWNRPLWIDPSGYEPKVDGQDIRLTIDLVIQEIAETEIAKAMNQYNAAGARAIVLDTQTGDILAMTDLLRWRKGFKEVTDDPMRRHHVALGRNRCLSDPYEPGSTFKTFVWSVATELGKASLNETIACSSGGGLQVGKRTIRDAHYYGPVSWRTVLVKSINTGMAIVAQRMTPAQLQAAVRKFGFGERTGLGLPGETAGQVTPAKSWTNYTQCSVAMGHEISVTPVQMVRAFAAFCRDGSIPKVRLVLPTDADAAERAGREDVSLRDAVAPATVALVREALRGVMTEGTGKLAESEKYTLFGKSGTAQLPKPKSMGKGYFEDRYVASFIAGAPVSDPRLVVLVVIDDPDRSKGHYGGAIAGPVVKAIAEQTLEYLGVAPDQPEYVEKLALARQAKETKPRDAKSRDAKAGLSKPGKKKLARR